MKSKTVILTTLLAVSFMLFAFVPRDQKPWTVPDKYKTMKNPTTPNDENLNLGKTLYNKHCKSCHGAKGLGDGPKAEGLESPIRSLGSKEYKSQTPGEKYYKSFVGRDEMPNFEKKIPDENEKWYIINYMETF
jgi:mono/diheme cytochrome c family protein